MSLTNSDIGRAALNGQTARTYSGNFSTDHFPLGSHYAAAYKGYLPARLYKILQERAPFIDQVVYSYSTPIAWRDNGVWIKPAVTYSATTSSKHSSQIAGRAVPWDAGMEEYLSVLAGRIAYDRYVGAYGTYRVLQAA